MSRHVLLEVVMGRIKKVLNITTNKYDYYLENVVIEWVTRDGNENKFTEILSEENMSEMINTSQLIVENLGE